MKKLLVSVALTLAVWSAQVQAAQVLAGPALAAQVQAPPAALDANQVRGGWETTINGVPHIFELRIVGHRISGAYCTFCDDANTLAFVDGRLGTHDLTFTITHVRDDGSTLYQDHVRGRVQSGHLIVSGHSGAPGGGDFTWTMRRDPSGPLPPGPPAPVFHYQQPGPWEPITPAKLAGVWLSGNGAGKQYFIIRRDGNTLRGLVCGPCDNPYSMAAMEDFHIQDDDDAVQWNICHEDHGRGPLPYEHHIIAHIADHELRLDAIQPNLRRIVSMTFLGPLPFSATARRAAATAAAALSSAPARAPIPPASASASAAASASASASVSASTSTSTSTSGSAAAVASPALSADEVRGGWEATVDGIRHVYEFTIRGSRVRGAYCAPCDDGHTLAYVHGTLDRDAMRFVVDHVRDDGSVAYRDHIAARIEGDHLAVSGQMGGPAGGAFSWNMRKDQRGPVPFGGVAIAEALPQPGAPAPNVAAYGTHGEQAPPGGLSAALKSPPWVPPGPWEQLSPARLQGLWLTGSGPGKQYFFIRRDGSRLFGLVCGPCDNPYTMVALVDFDIRGDTVTFNLAHEDNGLGSLPFYNHITARRTRNELRLVSIVPDNQPPRPGPARGLSLLGPVAPGTGAGN